MVSRLMIGYCSLAPGSLFTRVLAIDFGRCGVLVTSGVEVEVSGAAAGEGGVGVPSHQISASWPR